MSFKGGGGSVKTPVRRKKPKPTAKVPTFASTVAKVRDPVGTKQATKVVRKAEAKLPERQARRAAPPSLPPVMPAGGKVTVSPAGRRGAVRVTQRVDGKPKTRLVRKTSVPGEREIARRRRDAYEKVIRVASPKAPSTRMNSAGGIEVTPDADHKVTWRKDAERPARKAAAHAERQLRGEQKRQRRTYGIAKTDSDAKFQKAVQHKLREENPRLAADIDETAAAGAHKKARQSRRVVAMVRTRQKGKLSRAQADAVRQVTKKNATEARAAKRVRDRGLLGDAIADVKDTVTGAPAAVATIGANTAGIGARALQGKRPTKKQRETSKALVKGALDSPLGRLARGDVKGAAKTAIDHPVTSALSLAAGAGAAAKGVSVASKAAEAAKASGSIKGSVKAGLAAERAARAAQRPDRVVRQGDTVKARRKQRTSKQPVVRAVQRKVDARRSDANGEIRVTGRAARRQHAKQVRDRMARKQAADHASVHRVRGAGTIKTDAAPKLPRRDRDLHAFAEHELAAGHIEPKPGPARDRSLEQRINAQHRHMNSLKPESPEWKESRAVLQRLRQLKQRPDVLDHPSVQQRVDNRRWIADEQDIERQRGNVTQHRQRARVKAQVLHARGLIERRGDDWVWTEHARDEPLVRVATADPSDVRSRGAGAEKFEGPRITSIEHQAPKPGEVVKWDDVRPLSGAYTRHLEDSELERVERGEDLAVDDDSEGFTGAQTFRDQMKSGGVAGSQERVQRNINADRLRRKVLADAGEVQLTPELAKADAERMSRAGDIKYATVRVRPGEHVAVPEAVKRGYEAQVKAVRGVPGALGWLNKRFTRAVLPLSPSWHLGNAVDLTTRLLVSGALNPESREVYRALVDRMDDRGLANFKDQITGALGGAHFHAAGDWTAPRHRVPGLSSLLDAGFAAGSKVEKWAAEQAMGKVARDLHAEGRLDAPAPRLVGQVVSEAQEIGERLAQALHSGKHAGALRDEFAARVLEIVGDYVTHPQIRNLDVRAVVPFAQWIRASTKFVFDTMPRRHPYVTALLANIALMTEEDRRKLGLSNYISKQDAKDLGLPEPKSGFMGGAVPVGGSFVPVSPLTSAGTAGGLLPGPDGLKGLYETLGTASQQVMPQISGPVGRALGSRNNALEDGVREALKASGIDPDAQLGQRAGQNELVTDVADKVATAMLPGAGALKSALMGGRRPSLHTTTAKLVAERLGVEGADPATSGPTRGPLDGALYGALSPLKVTDDYPAAEKEPAWTLHADGSVSRVLEGMDGAKPVTVTVHPGGGLQVGSAKPVKIHADATRNGDPARPAKPRRAIRRSAAAAGPGATTPSPAPGSAPSAPGAPAATGSVGPAGGGGVVRAAARPGPTSALRSPARPAQRLSASSVSTDAPDFGAGSSTHVSNAMVDTAAREAGIDPDLFRRFVQQESGGQRHVGSPAGAQGPAQLMPATAAALGVDINDPMDNLRGGARYVAQQIEHFDGDLTKAIAAYNAGPGAVEQYGGVPPYAETQAYVKAVLGGYRGDGKASTDQPGRQGGGQVQGYFGDSLGVGTAPSVHAGKVNVKEGRTSSQALVLLQGYARRHDQDGAAVIFDVGTNDASIAQLKRNLAAAKKTGLQVYVPTLTATRGDIQAEAKNRAIRGLAGGNLHVVDLSGLTPDAGDGVHFTAQGYAKRAKLLKAALGGPGTERDAAGAAGSSSTVRLHGQTVRVTRQDPDPEAVLASIAALQKGDVAGFLQAAATVQASKVKTTAEAIASTGPAAALATPSKGQTPAVSPGRGGQAAVKYATKHLWVKEVGENRGPYIDALQKKFGFSGAPWCAMFTSTAIVKGGAPKEAMTASVGQVRAKAQAKQGYEGMVPSNRTVAGDLVMWGDDHIGMVVRRQGSRILMVAGNDSNRVQERWINASEVDAARPAYAKRKAVKR